MLTKFEIYKSLDGNNEVNVLINDDTVWLTQKQIIEIFESSKSNISEHIKQIFSTNELIESATVRKFRTVQTEGNRTVERLINHYNLDLIISIGYRVNTKRGTEFRQWASKRLKEYLIEGFAINEKRLEQKNKKIQILHDGIRILSRVIEHKSADNLDFSWLNHFSKGFDLLDDYDHDGLDVKGLNNKKPRFPEISEYENLLDRMRLDNNSKLFGKAKDEGFISAINQIKQTYNQEDAYPTIEEKASMLLYLIVKNHTFIDGNKRIAAACFLLYLDRNNLLFKSDGSTIISNEALASLTLFVALSQASEIRTVKNLIISVLNRSQKTSI